MGRTRRRIELGLLEIKEEFNLYRVGIRIAVLWSHLLKDTCPSSRETLCDNKKLQTFGIIGSTCWTWAGIQSAAEGKGFSLAFALEVLVSEGLVNAADAENWFRFFHDFAKMWHLFSPNDEDRDQHLSDMGAYFGLQPSLKGSVTLQDFGVIRDLKPHDPSLTTKVKILLGDVSEFTDAQNARKEKRSNRAMKRAAERKQGKEPRLEHRAQSGEAFKILKELSTWTLNAIKDEKFTTPQESRCAYESKDTLVSKTTMQGATEATATNLELVKFRFSIKDPVKEIHTAQAPALSIVASEDAGGVGLLDKKVSPRPAKRSNYTSKRKAAGKLSQAQKPMARSVEQLNVWVQETTEGSCDSSLLNLVQVPHDAGAEEEESKIEHTSTHEITSGQTDNDRVKLKKAKKARHQARKRQSEREQKRSAIRQPAGEVWANVSSSRLALNMISEARNEMETTKSLGLDTKSDLDHDHPASSPDSPFFKGLVENRAKKAAPPPEPYLGPSPSPGQKHNEGPETVPSPMAIQDSGRSNDSNCTCEVCKSFDLLLDTIEAGEREAQDEDDIQTQSPRPRPPRYDSIVDRLEQKVQAFDDVHAFAKSAGNEPTFDETWSIVSSWQQLGLAAEDRDDSLLGRVRQLCRLGQMTDTESDDLVYIATEVANAWRSISDDNASTLEQLLVVWEGRRW